MPQGVKGLGLSGMEVSGNGSAPHLQRNKVQAVSYTIPQGVPSRNKDDPSPSSVTQ